jgi:hypothetical protein
MLSEVMCCYAGFGKVSSGYLYLNRSVQVRSGYFELFQVMSGVSGHFRFGQVKSD